MTYTISILNMNGDIFQEIKYDNTDDLHEKLISLIKSYDADIYIQLLINENI